MENCAVLYTDGNAVFGSEDFTSKLKMLSVHTGSERKTFSSILYVCVERHFLLGG